ncbi:hypothetical protein HDK64DRAFT_254991 [Phyllosticta capitalensis]
MCHYSGWTSTELMEVFIESINTNADSAPHSEPPIAHSTSHKSTPRQTEMLSRSRNGIDAMPRPVNNAASPDYLLVRAREKLSPFAIKILEHYTDPGGLDSTETSLLLHALNTKAKKMKELQTESEFVAGLKRTSGEINQKEEPKFKRARMGEEGEGAGCPQPTTAAASKTVEDHTSLQPPTEQSGLQKLLHAAELKDSGFDALLQAVELSRNPQAVITEVGPPHAKSKRVEQTQGVEEHTRDLEDKLRSVSSALGAPLNMAIEDQGSSLPQSGSPIFRTAKVVDTTAQSPTSTTTGANQDDQAVRNGGIVPNTPIIIDLDDDEDDLDDEDDDEDNAVITHAGLQIE